MPYAGIVMSNSPTLLLHIAYLAATNYTNTEITPLTNPRLSDRLELGGQENKYLSAGPFDLLAATKRNADPLWFVLPLSP